MKKILGIIVAALIVVAMFLTACNNKPPYLRLAAAIDSLNAQYESTHETKDKFISYETWENIVHFNVDFPIVIDNESFEPIAENIKTRFLDKLVEDDEFGIATEILDAKSNIIIDIHGLNDTSYEVLIVTNEIATAYDAAREVKNQIELNREAAMVEQAEEAPDTLARQEIEKELLEGNAPSIEEEIAHRR